jgi:hypothetical protein
MEKNSEPTIIEVNLSAEELKKLRAMAAEQGQAIGEILRIATREWVMVHDSSAANQGTDKPCPP